MATVRLTDVMVARAKAKDGKRLELWDGRESGLVLRVGGADGQKTWSVRYRTPSGQRRRFTIGTYPAVDLKRARIEAARIKGRVQVEKADPQGERAAEREARQSAPTVRDLAERYMEEHAATKLRPATRRLYAMLWRLHVLPAIADKPVAEVAWSDIDAIHRALADRPSLANRSLVLVSGAFKLAQRWGWFPHERANPGRGHDRYTETRIGKALDAEQLGRLGAALAEEPDNVAVAIIRTLLYTGARPVEIMGLEWRHVAGDRREIDLPMTKTGRRSVYLSRPAARIVGAQPPGGEYVFANPATGRPFAHLKGTWPRVRERAGLGDFRLYDACRHTFTTRALEMGVPLERVKRLVGHSIRDLTAGTYGHIARAVLLADADRVAGEIDTALRSRLGSVITFPVAGQP